MNARTIPIDLPEMRQRRDDAARAGDHSEALRLNDAIHRITDASGLLLRPMQAAIADAKAQRIPISGAKAQDVQAARERIRLSFQLVGSLVTEQLSKLNESLSYPIDISDWMAGLADLAGEIDGRLEATEDGLS